MGHDLSGSVEAESLLLILHLSCSQATADYLDSASHVRIGVLGLQIFSLGAESDYQVCATRTFIC